MNSESKPAVFASRIRRVGSFQELVSTPFVDGVNAMCWERSLRGDFREVAEALEVGEGISPLEEMVLRNLSVSPAGREAIDVMLSDLELLRAHGLAPELDCVTGSVPAAQDGPVRTDVGSFHADSATVEADTWLCTYLGASSEGVRNEEAIRRVDVPETRAQLLSEFGGEDDEAFLEYFHENYFDLHYVPTPDATIYSFGVGNLWRIAVEYPGCPVPPCIHRAPMTLPGDPRRLLLIS